MKKILAWMLVLAMMLSFAACSQPASQPAATEAPAEAETPAEEPAAEEPAEEPAAEDPQVFVGVAIFNYANNFVGYIRNGIEYYIKNDLGGKVEYLIVDGENDQAKENEKIDTMINKGVNVLAINLVDSQAASTIIEKAKAADLPVIFFNKNPSQEDLDSYDKCWYVGLDGTKPGQEEGMIAVNAWTSDQEKWDTNGDGVLQYVILQGEPGHSDTPLRTDGFTSYIKESGISAEELDRQPANWSTATAKEVMETWIGKYGDKIEMVICNNDAMALGAVEALRGNGLITDEKYIPVIGINALPETAELIKSGIMLGSVLTSTYDQSKAIIDLCVNAVKGVDDITEGTDWELLEDKSVRIPDTLITADNVDIAFEAYKTAE